MIASGNLPDIISYTISDLELLGFKDGAVIDLSDLIEKHAPNIKRFMKEHPRLAKDMYAYNGKIYALPTYYDYDKLNVTTTIFIRTDWLKKFNLKVPSTIEEMEKVLTTIVNGDANGNGKKDEIPLAGSIIGWNDQVERFIINSFIYCDLDTNISADAELNTGYLLDGKKVDTAVNKPA